MVNCKLSCSIDRKVRYRYLCIGVVRVPGGSKRLLTPQVPHDEVDVVPDDLLHVAADGWRRVDHLVHQELVQNCCLPSVVQAHQADLVF